ncbi:MAG: hypothetical protein ACP5O3_00260 [Candidatus Micrarchaeia archaeon]|jgi:translin
MTDKLSKAINRAIAELSEKEKRQDAAIALSREIVRDCALAIKAVHQNEWKEAEKKLAEITPKIKKMHSLDEGLEHVSQQCYQEYAEIKCLEAITKKKEIPDYDELGIDAISWMNGLADCAGELRRALQLALSSGDKEQAKYLFQKMNEIYDNLMLVKYSSSLVGGLKHKQDVVRSQVEQARSEILRFS